MTSTQLQYASIAELTAQTEPSELGDALEKLDGGAEAVSAAIFQHYRDSFVPARSEGEAGIIQFVVKAAGGTVPYVIDVNDGSCDIHRGEAAEPTATITLSLADLVQMTTGQVNGAVLAMTGRLEVGGDAGTAMNLKEWFATD